MKLNHLFKQLNLDVSHVEKVHGGDINETYCLHTTKAKFFLKINIAKQYPDMFLKEANGLETLRQHTQFPIPKVLDHGTINNLQYLLLEWVDKGIPSTDTQFKLGAGIAKMHQVSQDYFGFEEDNYIGSLLQTNSPKEDWAAFYTHCRILPLVKLLRDANTFSKKMLKKQKNTALH
ncbi:fructosamine kinase family protein [Niabella ginsengisoli]|uniref:fructosamine kinase family protein n=1 Tax=Niabella ginsengisoli TaxID=522298 RepID=UPI0021D41314|nr:fructosamine kinase family protein [Niabella ginsengisoli]